ncbi:MAG: hypothetical protein MZW92_66765 [Comamonadaceae bacterium]|nr:hypothetical protein [Comamonadaceae bacterium]
MLETIAGYLQIDPWPPQPGVVFWGALALVAGALLGEAARRWFGVPRIVGCSAVGLAIGLAGFGGGMLAGPARLVVDLALALLLFELGSRVRLRWLQANPALLATSALEAFASLAAIYLVLRWAGQPVHVALACATLCTSASGAVIARVAGELKSAGQVTERMIVLTALNTLLAVLAHKPRHRLAAPGRRRRLPRARCRRRCGPSAARCCCRGAAVAAGRRCWRGGWTCATRTPRCCCSA